MHLVKLVVLGATGTGKSSIIQQFLESTFIESRGPTILNPIDNSYSFTIIMNGCVYQLKIIDMPMINYFPTNSFYEWTDYRGCALRSAHGYLLIFDLTSPGSFQYVKVIRDQLSESRNMSNIPVYVVGNKADLCTSVLNNMRSSHSHHSSHSRYSLYPLTYPRFSGLTLSSFSSSHHHSSWLSTRTQRNTHFNSSSAAQQQQTQNQQPNQQPNQQQTQQQQQTHSSSSSSHHHHHHHRLHFHHNHHHWDDLTPAFKELANLVKKQWKCNYLECSAKYNWRIVPIFRDILRLIEINQSKCLDHSANYISGDLDYHRDSIKFSLTSTTLNQPTSNNQLVTTSSTTNPIVTISTLSPTINDRTSTINDSNNNTNHQSCIIL